MEGEVGAMNIHFLDGPRAGELRAVEHAAPFFSYPAWTREGMCEDRYRIAGLTEDLAEYAFEGRWLFPVFCEDDECELCLADPSLREWKQVEVDDG